MKNFMDFSNPVISTRNAADAAQRIKNGEKIVGDITSADIRDLLNQEMNDGYAYTTVKKVHVLLNEYFRYLTQQELIVKNPMISTPMIKL